MKQLKILCLVLLTACLLTVTVYGQDPFSIRTSLDARESVQSCTIPVTSGEVLELNAQDLELRLQMEPGELRGITITALPGFEQGALYLDGAEVEVYDFLTREEVDRLCFVHNETAAGASISFVPQGSDAVTTSLNISVIRMENSAPTVEGASFDTLKNVSINGFISVVDPEEDEIQIQVVQQPRKGEVRFNGANFVYEPYRDMTGPDSFVVVAVDSVGNYSQEAVVDISIENSKFKFSYADMTGNPSQYAVLKLHDRGVVTGRQIGDAWFFNPNDQLNRGDFLIMLLAAADLEVYPTVNTGLPNDTSLPSWLKPYVMMGIEVGIIDGTQPFNYGEIPTRAEAVLMTDRAAEINDVKEFSLPIPDAGEIPDWALESYRDLAAYRMLDLHYGYAYPGHALTNSYGADLAWQLYKHSHR